MCCSSCAPLTDTHTHTHTHAHVRTQTPTGITLTNTRVLPIPVNSLSRVMLRHMTTTTEDVTWATNDVTPPPSPRGLSANGSVQGPNFISRRRGAVFVCPYTNGGVLCMRVWARVCVRLRAATGCNYN